MWFCEIGAELRVLLLIILVYIQMLKLWLLLKLSIINICILLPKAGTTPYESRIMRIVIVVWSLKSFIDALIIIVIRYKLNIVVWSSQIE